MKMKYLLSATTLILATSMPPAFSSIQIGATRVIYHAAEKDVSVQIMNPGKYPVLLQSWTDDGNADIRPDVMRTPFILTPPLARVNADAGQTLRMSYVGASLPTDRESVYWLNVLEIPPVGERGSSQIQVAFRSRIKIFFRPEALDNKGAMAAIKQLQWRTEDNKIVLSNPTSYYVSAVSVVLKHRGQMTTVPVDMVPPYGSTDFTLPPGMTADGVQSVTVDAINDYGASVTAPVSQL